MVVCIWLAFFKKPTIWMVFIFKYIPNKIDASQKRFGILLSTTTMICSYMQVSFFLWKLTGTFFWLICYPFFNFWLFVFVWFCIVFISYHLWFIFDLAKVKGNSQILKTTVEIWIISNTIRTIGFLRKLPHIFSRQTLINICTPFVRSYLDYVDVIFDQAYNVFFLTKNRRKFNTMLVSL